MAEAATDGLELALRGGRSGWRGARLAAEAERWSALLAPLAMAMPAIAPPAALAARIDHAVDRADHDLSQTFEERLDDGGWRELAPGIEIKPLWDESTYLVRCRPGAVWPATPDRRLDHVVILQGDMRVGGQSYRAGDYCSLPAGTAQGALSSRTGLTMLVRSS